MVPQTLQVVTLGARDFTTLRDFYVRLGWALAIDSDDFAAFATRGAVLAIFPADKLAADGRVSRRDRADGFRGFSLAFTVPQPKEVDTTIEAVRSAGGRITKEPVDAEFYEGRSAYFTDPEDNLWEIAWLGPGNEMTGAIANALSEPGGPRQTQ